MKTFKELFNEYSDLDVNIDKKKLIEISEFYEKFIRKNDDYIDFFGSSLLGTKRVIFSSEDSNVWVEDVCGIQAFGDLREDFHNHPDVDKTRNVQGNPLNYTFTWLVYKCLNTTKASEKDRVATAQRVMSMLQVKYLTSLMKGSFSKYLANETLAEEAYEELSRRHLIKKHGSWRELIEYRSSVYISPKYPRFKYLKNFSNNLENAGVVSDIQTRIRSQFNNVRNVLFDLEKQARKTVVTSFDTIDGNKVMKEFRNDVVAYRSKMAVVMDNKEDFIKAELVDKILLLVPTVTRRNLLLLLEAIHENAGKENKKDITESTMGFVVYLFGFARKKNLEEDIYGLIKGIANAIRANRTVDKELEVFKEDISYMVDKTLNVKHEATKGATRVATSLYIALRILTIPYYNI